MSRITPLALISVACAAQFLVVLDISIVTVALPDIRADLGFGAEGLEWVVIAYTLTFASLLLFGGRAADVFGATRMFVVGLALFVGASLVGGLAGSPEILVSARAAQGVGAALLSPTTLSVLLAHFPQGRQRVAALAAWGAVGSVGGACGSLLGGVLTDSWSWRWVLLINVPLGLLILLAGRCVLPRTAPDGRGRLDLPGAVSATLGVAALTYAVSGGPTHGWDSWQVLGAGGLSLVGLIWFLLLQSNASRARLMPLELFRMRSFALGNLLMLLAGGVVVPLWYFVSLYLQEIAGYSAIVTGLAFLPHTLAMVAGARLSPALLRTIGPRALTAGGAGAAAIGFLWHAQITPSSPLISGALLPGALICFGLSVTFTPLASTATSELRTELSGLASGVLNTARQIGGAIGLAALTSLALIAAPAPESGGASISGVSAVFLASATGCALIAAGAWFLPRVAREKGSAHAGSHAQPFRTS